MACVADSDVFATKRQETYNRLKTNRNLPLLLGASSRWLCKFMESLLWGTCMHDMVKVDESTRKHLSIFSTVALQQGHAKSSDLILPDFKSRYLFARKLWILEHERLRGSLQFPRIWRPFSTETSSALFRSQMARASSTRDHDGTGKWFGQNRYWHYALVKFHCQGSKLTNRFIAQQGVKFIHVGYRVRVPYCRSI